MRSDPYPLLMARRRLITVEEAILLHLSEFKRYFGEDTVPLEMTQAGISLSIGVRRSHVSSSLDSAKEKGNVEEKLAHVKGESRRRKSYLLTDVGVAEAGKVRARVADSVVKASLPEGEGFEGTLGELLSSLNADLKLARASLLCLDGTVNLPVRTRTESDESVWTESIPHLEPFYGREGELAELKDGLGLASVLAVYGIPGIGKSTLVAEGIGRYGKDYRSFWFSISEWSSPRNTVGHLAGFLESLRFDRLGRYLEAHEVPDLADVSDILGEVKERIVLVFDDCHLAGRSLLLFLKMLASVSRKTDNIKLILLSRRKLDFMPGPEAGAGVVLRLGGLDKDSSIGMLKDRGFGNREAEAVAAKSGGHPLYLALVGGSGKGPVEGDITSLLAREIFDTMSDAEREVMFSLSVFRNDVRTDAVARDADQLKALESLERRHLAWSTDGWHMHNLLKDFFYERQSRDERLSRHESAAEYYNLYANDVPGQIEETYHLFQAGDSESALLLFGLSGNDWLKGGYVDEILHLSSFIPEVSETTAEMYEVMLLKARALEQTGEWVMAAQSFHKCIGLAEEAGDDERLSGALQHKGALLYREGRLDEALTIFRNALAGSISRPLEARLHNSMGVVHWRKGETARAKEAYETDLKISEETGDHNGLARALNNLGILDWQSGDSDAALEKYAKALDSAERMSDKKLVAILYSNIADAYKFKGNKLEARRFYERCLTLSEDLKFNWQTAEAYRGLADLVGDRDAYLNKALMIFERLGAKEDAKAVRSMMR